MHTTKMNEATMMDLLGASSAIAAAARAGIVTALLARGATTPELAKDLSLDPRALGLVLGVLKAYGFLESAGDRWSATDAFREVAARVPGGNEMTFGLWSHVPDFLRTGTPFLRMDRAPEEREQAYRDVVGRLGAMFAASAKELAAKIPGHPKRILDVGCGSGIWSLSIASRVEASRVTGLDFPAVLQSFRTKAKELGLADRIDFIEGDVHSVDVPKRAFDLVVVANVLRLETPERAKRIVDRIAPAVAEGGALLVIDALGEGTPEKERARAIYALHLGMRTEQGSVHAPQTIRGWLAEAGLARIEAIDVATNPGAVGALLARV